MGSEIRLHLSEDDSDAERIDAPTRYLRDDLLQLGVEDVTTLQVGPPPPGTRGFDLDVVGGLLVTFLCRHGAARRDGNGS